jgi:hypothetical protein
MSDIPSAFAHLEQSLAEGGVDALLEQLTNRLREEQKYHELFEALKMRVRRELDLPLLYNDTGDELEEQRRTRLEEGLLEACREVGGLILDEGRIREGWMYLRPVGNRTEVAKRLGDIEPTDENVEELIEVCLHEGVDPARGFQLVLDHYGTCNAITTFESTLRQQAQSDQQIAAGLLVDHLHKELKASVVADIARQEEKQPEDGSLAELVAERPSLFGEYAYHIDTTHLASTVRFSRNLENPDQLRLAVDLVAYGCRLHSQFQYPGEEPFVDLYPSHMLYLSALLGDNVDEAVDLFRKRAATVDPAEHGTSAVESFIQLLDRLGRHDDAVEALLGFAVQHETPPQQVLPLLLDLSKKSGNFAPLLDFCKGRSDLLGFATGLALST